MTRAQALPYVSYIADDAGSFRKPTGDPADDIAQAVLVGWQCGFEPLFVACKSYLPGVRLDAEEAAELALDGLVEIDWFNGLSGRVPDYIIEPI